MKRSVCFLLVIVLLSLTLPVFAENPPASSPNDGTPDFDRSVFESSELYSYDKFKKSWTVQARYDKKYSNADVVVWVLLFNSYIEKGWGPELRVQYFDKKNDCYDKVTAFRALVGETLFTFELDESTNRGYAFGGSVFRDLLNSLDNASEVAFQLDHTDKFGDSWTLTIDPVAPEDLREIIEIASMLEASHTWENCEYYYSNDFDFNATKE